MVGRSNVPNLQRRGNIFYWRARMPIRLQEVKRAKHLAFSLKQSDHRKAAYIARKLNLLLFEISEAPRSVLMTKEALERLFQTEIARVTERMEELKFVGARTTGGFHRYDNLAADIEVGWAYRLLEKIGTRQILFENENCKGWRFLQHAHVPEHFHQGIVTTYRGERIDAESPRFQNEIRALMRDHGLPYSILNLEKAKAEYFKARADVLLNTEGRYLTEFWDFDDPRDESKQVSKNAVQETLGDSTSKTEARSPQQSSMNVHEDATAIQQQLYNPIIPQPPSINAHGMTVVGGRDIPIKDLMKECENLIANNRQNWRDDTADDVRVIVRIFGDVLQEAGIKQISEIRQQHIAGLRQHFNQILANWGRSSRYRSMKPSQLRSATELAVKMATRTGKALPKVGLSHGTIRRHLGNLEQFLNHLTASGYSIVSLTMQGLKPKKSGASTARYLTEKPDPERIRPIFEIPVFTGCAGPEKTQWSEQGSNVYHSSLYYVPMLLTYLGARRAEISGLSTDDVFQRDGVWLIHIRATKIRKLKNNQSDRLLPLPKELLRLGFIDYTKRIKQLGYQALFPELHAPDKLNDTGDKFYKCFVPLLAQSESLDGKLWGRTLHALRHGFSDTLKQLGVNVATIDDITGHSGRTEGEVRYTSVAGPELMQKAIDQYPAITADLEPQPLKLLPFVETKSPAPWFRQKRKRSSPNRKRQTDL